MMRPGLLARWLGVTLVVGTLLPVPPFFPSAEAQAQSRSSGGYSRPSGGSRTPSSSSFGSSSRTPSSSSYSRSSSSGGYSLPGSGGSFGSRRPSVVPGYGSSAGDRSYTREQSGDVLRRMRERAESERQRAEQAARPPATSQPSAGGGWGTGGWGSTAGGYRPAPRSSWPSDVSSGWYRNRGYQVPGNVMNGPRSFGMWDAAFLYFLLSTLSQSGHADFFRNHQDDPGFREWRRDAEQRAQEDPQMRASLDDLDRRLAESRDQPRDPNYLPPGVPPEVATGTADAADRRTPSVEPAGGGGGIPVSVIGVVVVGGGLLGLLAWRRSRAAGNTGSIGGSGGMGPAGTLRSGAEMLRHKASGEGYTPSRFRVGMTLTVDPTPFLLTAGSTHVPSPSNGGEVVSVTEVGQIAESGAGRLVRLYLPEGRAMFQLHVGRDGEPDECRYFAVLDEVTPADEAEWGAWLDPREGMIGWPEFQTKDGKLYGRAWSPGQSRVEPRELVEEVASAQGTRTVRSQAMLYAAPTGAPAPAPQTEYILVSAIQDGSQAWVEVRAGLDVSLASLSLA
ncbi:DUF2491 family protein [Roseomonas sp. BN140053]|uniref:DUF2491 family protein n=1 Tax=Roseomonas sp. BN140053 TaxID=3391898 RepID=UPI0039EA1780